MAQSGGGKAQPGGGKAQSEERTKTESIPLLVWIWIHASTNPTTKIRGSVSTCSDGVPEPVEEPLLQDVENEMIDPIIVITYVCVFCLSFSCVLIFACNIVVFSLSACKLGIIQYINECSTCSTEDVVLAEAFLLLSLSQQENNLQGDEVTILDTTIGQSSETQHTRTTRPTRTRNALGKVIWVMGWVGIGHGCFAALLDCH
jgi:hypothetical protein